MSNELKMRVQKFGSSLSSCQFRWVQKKLKGGGGGVLCVCVTIPLVAIVMWGVFTRAAQSL